MGAKYREAGGGPAVGVADSWARMLQSLMGGGGTSNTQGTYALNRNGAGMMGVLGDLLSPGAGVAGADMTRMLGNQAKDIRAQYANIGGGYGTAAANAEGMFRQGIPGQIAQLQLSAIMPLLGYINSFAGKGVAQRQGFMQPSDFMQGLQAIAGTAKGVAPFFAGGAAPSSDMTAGLNAGDWNFNIPVMNPSMTGMGAQGTVPSDWNFNIPTLTPGVRF